MTDLALLEQRQRAKSRVLENIVFSSEESEIVVQQQQDEVLIWGGVTFLVNPHQLNNVSPAYNLLPQTWVDAEWLEKKWNLKMVWDTILNVPFGHTPEEMMSKMMSGTLSSAKSGEQYGGDYNPFQYIRETKTYQIDSRPHFKPPDPRVIVPNRFVPVFIQGIFYDKEKDIVVMSRDASQVLRKTPINPDKGVIGKAWRERNTDSSSYIRSVYMAPPEDNCMLYHLMDKSLTSTGYNFVVHLRSENLFNLSRRGFLYDAGSIGGAYMLSTSLPQQQGDHAVVYRKSDGAWWDVSSEYNFTNNIPPVHFKIGWGI